MNTHSKRGPERAATGPVHARGAPAQGAAEANRKLSGLALVWAVLAVPGMLVAAGPEPVDLGSAGPFAILAASAITSTGGGTLVGDVGLSPTTGAAITGLLTNQVRGTLYAVDTGGPAGSVAAPGLLATAKVDLAVAYYEAAARTNADIVWPAGGEIGGMTLGPGLYKFASTVNIAGADVTLTGDVDDVWIFQVGTALTMGSGIQVVLAGRAQARNIFWQVGSSATLGTSSRFKGTLLADQSITMDTGCVVEGRALARVAAVTFNGQSIGLPQPAAPRFTAIFRPTTDAATVVLETTPYCPLTLKACPDLLLANWTRLVTATPTATPWTYTDLTETAAVTQRFYRAYITAERDPYQRP